MVIATCDHWHAPAAILACQAGKHVYVEKPCSHNVREGRQMIEAARRHGRVMQHGTQSRSSSGVIRAIGMLREGVIGEVLVAKHVNSQKRRNIGHEKAARPPAHLDYDLWVGPAEWAEYQANYVHYHWHWFYNFGTGDIGNDGVHGIDLARWGLGVETHPNLATGYGSKLYFDDDQEFPDTYTVTFVYPGGGGDSSGTAAGLRAAHLVALSKRRSGEQPLLLRHRGDDDPGRAGNPDLRQEERTDPPGRTVQAHQGCPSEGLPGRHSIRRVAPWRTSRSATSPPLSPTLGNIVARTNRSVRFDPVRERIVGDDEADALLARRYRSRPLGRTQLRCR